MRLHALLGVLLDLCIRTWLLFPELVARESKDLEALQMVLIPELGQLTVVTGCNSSLCGNVHNKHALLACDHVAK